MDRVLLTGFGVTVLVFVLPLILNLFGLEIPLDFLADGELTLGEALGFIGTVLVGLSKGVRSALKQVFTRKKED